MTILANQWPNRGPEQAAAEIRRRAIFRYQGDSPTTATKGITDALTAQAAYLNQVRDYRSTFDSLCDVTDGRTDDRRLPVTQPDGEVISEKEWQVFAKRAARQSAALYGYKSIAEALNFADERGGVRTSKGLKKLEEVTPEEWSDLISGSISDGYRWLNTQVLHAAAKGPLRGDGSVQLVQEFQDELNHQERRISEMFGELIDDAGQHVLAPQPPQRTRSFRPSRNAAPSAPDPSARAEFDASLLESVAALGQPYGALREFARSESMGAATEFLVGIKNLASEIAPGNLSQSTNEVNKWTQAYTGVLLADPSLTAAFLGSSDANAPMAVGAQQTSHEVALRIGQEVESMTPNLVLGTSSAPNHEGHTF